jgi:hypothetical protein
VLLRQNVQLRLGLLVRSIVAGAKIAGGKAGAVDHLVTRLLLAAAAIASCAAAQVCVPSDFQGAYGALLEGTSTISGHPTPIAGVARLVLDGRGKISGLSSVNFNGLFLGNPVTGTYEITKDCAMTWKLQDDSGAWQHFAGTAVPGGNRVDFRQTDLGAGARGTLQRMPQSCGTGSFGGRYAFGASEALANAGNLTLIREGKTTAGSYTVDSDCFVTMDFDGINLRGVVVNGGREIDAIQTDPERVSAVRFLAK